jgi:hypothetical protein
MLEEDRTLRVGDIWRCTELGHETWLVTRIEKTQYCGLMSVKVFGYIIYDDDPSRVMQKEEYLMDEPWAPGAFVLVARDQ